MNSFKDALQPYMVISILADMCKDKQGVAGYIWITVSEILAIRLPCCLCRDGGVCFA